MDTKQNYKFKMVRYYLIMAIENDGNICPIVNSENINLSDEDSYELGKTFSSIEAAEDALFNAEIENFDDVIVQPILQKSLK